MKKNMFQINCPKCNCRFFLRDKICECGYEIIDDEGIYILTDDKNDFIDKNNTDYISYSSLASYYKSRDINNKLHISTANYIKKEFLKPDYVMLDLGAGTGIPGFHIINPDITYIAGDISVEMLKIFKQHIDKSNF